MRLKRLLPGGGGEGRFSRPAHATANCFFSAVRNLGSLVRNLSAVRNLGLLTLESAHILQAMSNDETKSLNGGFAQ